MSGGVVLRPSRRDDLAWVVALERHADNRELIGQWGDEEHLVAMARKDGREHWLIERNAAPAGYMISYDGRAEYGGAYLKRILVADRERGTGRAAIGLFLEAVFARPGMEFVWLCVRAEHDRAQHVYRQLGFRVFEPTREEAARLALRGDVPGDDVFRMRIRSTDYRAPG